MTRREVMAIRLVISVLLLWFAWGVRSDLEGLAGGIIGGLVGHWLPVVPGAPGLTRHTDRSDGSGPS